MNREAFIKQANDRYRLARDFWRNWRVQARDDFAFVSGDQWLADDEAVLNEQKRPPITFNYSEKMIDAVVGAEVSNRQETRFLPRGVEDSPLAELWNYAAKWVRDEGDAEDEECDAFRNMLICGLGWTYTHPSYEEDLDGTVAVDAIDSLEMFPDPAASKVGLKDRRFHFRLYWVDKKDVKAAWPKAPLSSPEEENQSGGVIRHAERYDDDDHQDERERHKDQVQLRHYECYEYEYVYRVASGEQIAELSEDEFKAAKKAILAAGLQFVRQRKRVYYFAFFIGETMLQMEKSPCQHGFLFNCITGKRDRNRNTWYGLTKVMKDPQRWANKWLSQILHIINSNAKGGLLAEVNAFVDQKKAEAEWAQPDSVTLLNEGALSGGKVQQKQTPPYPSGLDKLMEFALGSLPMVTGINLEALGLANREQAGVLEAARKQAAYGLLSPLFDSLRRYRKTQGRVLLHLINDYISDGRLIRIGGPESQQFVPLTKQPDSIRYDIIVDQAPTAPDVKQKTWETLTNILPAMMKAGYPIPPDVLDFVPLPVSLAMKWKEHVGQQAQADKEAQEEIQRLKEENDSLKKNHEMKVAELQLKQQEKMAELDMREREMRADMEMQQERMLFDFQMEKQKAELQMELERIKMGHQLALEEERAAHQMEMEERRTEAQAKAIEKKANQPAKQE